jgi:hypothetical protein
MLESERTYIKTLPNLPDDDEINATERQPIENNDSSSGDIKDYGLEITHTPSVSKSA